MQSFPSLVGPRLRRAYPMPGLASRPWRCRRVQRENKSARGVCSSRAGPKGTEEEEKNDKTEVAFRLPPAPSPLRTSRCFAPSTSASPSLRTGLLPFPGTEGTTVELAPRRRRVRGQGASPASGWRRRRKRKEERGERRRKDERRGTRGSFSLFFSPFPIEREGARVTCSCS